MNQLPYKPTINPTNQGTAKIRTDYKVFVNLLKELIFCLKGSLRPTVGGLIAVHSLKGRR